MHNFLFVKNHFQHTNPLIHKNSRLQYANTKLTSPYYMNYRYIIKPNFCEGALSDFDPIKNYFIFSPLYAKTNRPILVPIEYLQCVEGGATKCTCGHTFNLLYKDWMVDKLENSHHQRRYRSSITSLRNNHTVTMICILVLSLLVWHVIRISSPSSVIQIIEPRTSSSNTERRPQPYNTLGLTVPKL